MAFPRPRHRTTWLTGLIVCATVGPCTAVYAIVSAVLLQPLPYRHDERLVMVREAHPERGETALRPVTFTALREETGTFESAAAFGVRSLVVTGGDALPVRLPALLAATEPFGVLGVLPAAGRPFTEEEVALCSGVAILLDGTARRLYGGASGALGRRIELDGVPHEVVGVMPPDFQAPWQADLIVPYPRLEAADWQDRFIHRFGVIARLANGVDREQARAALDLLARRLAAALPDAYADWRFPVHELRERILGRTRGALIGLLLSTVLFFALGTANLCIHVLIKSLAEERNIGIRRSLGATPLRVLRHVVGSNLRGVMAGLALALLLANALVRLTRAFPVPTRVPFEFRPVLTVEAAAMAGGLTILATLLASVLGWRRALRGPEFAWLRTTQVALPATASRLRGFLAAGQIALATLLASHALLVVATLLKLERSDLGFDPDRVVTFDLMFSETRFPHDRQRAAFVDTLLQRVRAVPGVAAAGASTYVPLENRLVTRRLKIPGHLRAATPAARYNAVTPGLFETLRLRLVEGRGFDQRDSASRRRVAIVNEAFARRYLPEGRAVGASFTVLDEPSSGTMEVVGVVGDVAQNGVDVAPAPMLYVPFDQEPQLWFSLVVRPTVEPTRVAGAVRAELRRLDPLTAASAPRTMDERIAAGTAPWRLAGVVMGAVAVIGLTLAMTGTYVVASYGAALREREFGLRQALGASPREIAFLVLAGSARVAALGASVGLLASLGLSRAWESWLHGTGATPLGVSVAVSAGVIAAALLLTLTPALRAMRAAPALVLARE